MVSQAVFIDLPNFYSSLIRSNLAEPDLLRSYFLHWLDLDLLTNRLTNSSANIWVFYSKEKIGPKEARINDDYLRNYINRINNIEGVTARDVNIPGEQREWLDIKCEKCGTETTSELKSEKGIDTSLTVHLFDTMDAWDVAYLLSGDADFVPVVVSLRRRGKIVIGAGSPKASSALVRECYSYINLIDIFFKEDVALYKLFKTDGVLAQWLNSVKPDPTFESEDIGGLKVKISWSEHGTSNYNDIYINIQGHCDIESLRKEFLILLNDDQFQFRENLTEGLNFSFFVSSVHLQGLKRRMPSLPNRLEGYMPKWEDMDLQRSDIR